MRIILSRKGFDSTAGGVPSPIVKGRPVSFPIPEKPPSPTTYNSLGLGDLVVAATRSRLTGDSNCHDDPLFADGYCWFGQSGAAQGHLRKQGVCEGDVFLFFGLFADPESGERHHRIFGFMRVARVAQANVIAMTQGWLEPPRPHPHLSDKARKQNTIYFGPGATANNADDKLRLTIHGGPLNRWRLPEWFSQFGLSYHAQPERWLGNGQLDSAKRGQEFVCNTGEDEEARRWLEDMIAQMMRPASTDMY